MKHMLNSTILDIAAVSVLILCGLNGARKGIILSISRIVSLLAAYFGASFLTGLFSPVLSEYVVGPKIREWFSADPNLTALTNAAKEAYLAFDKAVEAIQSLLNSGLGIPGFISEPLAEDIAKNPDPGTILNTAVSVVSNRLSEILVFAVAFALILALAFLLFRVVDRVLDFTPLGAVNRFFGFILGIILGAVLVFVVMSVVPKVVPSLSSAGMFFSEETVKNSIVMEKLNLLLETARAKI